MFYFIANPRDGMAGGSSCGCCCETVSMTPGETNMLSVNYSAWVIPMAFNGITVNTWFDLERISPEPTAGNTAIIWTPAEATAIAGVEATGDLTANATGPEGATLTWFPMPLYGPNNGDFVLNSDGTWEYTPNAGFKGTEVIYYTVSDGYNKVVGTLAIAVGNPPAQLTHAPAPLSVLSSRKQIVYDRQTMNVPLAAAPDAVPGTRYRITVRQEAIDCDGNKYYHVSCYDVVIGKC